MFSWAPGAAIRCADRRMAPRYDILALDIDGTLLRSDKSLADRDAQAVRVAARAGVTVVLATARPPRSTRPILEALGLFDPALALTARRLGPAPGAGASARIDGGGPLVVSINYNGALLWEHAGPGAGRGSALDHLPLEASVALRAVEHARKIEPKVSVWVEALDRWFTDRATHEFDDGQTEGTILGTETSKSHGPDEIGELAGVLRVAPTKVMFLAPPARLTRVLVSIDEKFARRGLLSCKVSDAHLFSVCHAEADKALGLKRLAHRLGVPRERVMAIGDAPNDAAMLTWAGRGLAVKNAWDEAKRAADGTLGWTNDECAVARAIERELLS